MISMISGKVEELGTNHAVVSIGSPSGAIGYKVFTTIDTILGLKVGQNVKFWIHTRVREDALDLYGFVTKRDKELFELLITVSGVGPKSALNIMSLVSSDALISAVRTGSTAHLVKISGIGKKTAEKVVLELKDKVNTLAGYEGGDSAAGMASDIDAIEALKALGYDAEESREALKKVGKDVKDVGAKVKAALKMLG